MNPQNVITIRGPNLSVNLPITMASKPCTIQESENAPEVSALVQTRSVSIGLKKTPNEANIPNINILTKKEATTTI